MKNKIEGERNARKERQQKRVRVGEEDKHDIHFVLCIITFYT